MAQKNNFPFSIREYRPSDRHQVMSLFCDGILENVYPAFFKAMMHPDHVGIALSISMAGYVLGGSSYLQALLFGGAFAGLIYYCCYDIYETHMIRRLSSDMADIPAGYLDDPGSGFWVAEDDRAKVVGMAAVAGRGGGEASENGDVAGAFGGGSGSYGELSALVVAFPWRRKALGSELTQKALEFCKERGYGRLVMDVSSPQAAAVAMCGKLGFVQTASHRNTHANRWFSKLAAINVLRMEKAI